MLCLNSQGPMQKMNKDRGGKNECALKFYEIITDRMYTSIPSPDSKVLNLDF